MRIFKILLIYVVILPPYLKDLSYLNMQIINTNYLHLLFQIMTVPKGYINLPDYVYTT